MKLYDSKWDRLMFRCVSGLFGLGMTLVGILFVATTLWPSIAAPPPVPPTGTETVILLVAGVCLLLGGPVIVYAAIAKPLGFGMDDA